MTWDLIKNVVLLPGEGTHVVTYVYWLFLIVLVGIEFFAPQLQASHRGHRWPANFGLGLINMALTPLVPISVLWASEWAERQRFGVLNLLDASWWPLIIILTIALQSFVDYTFHFFSHKAPLLWRVHRVHHFDTAIDVSTGLRHHPFEMLLAVTVGIPAAIIFGLLPLALIIYGSADAMFALFTHANVKLPAGLERVLRIVLVTPRIHAVHHSSYQPETDSNYGSVFTFWDRLFGTYCDLRAHSPEKMEFGLNELRDQRTCDLWWQLMSPVRPVAAKVPVLSAPSDPS
jgi:sterol desaturase/sphingolipid hydroxylase (fatty acid hydroxylase superfamily)